MGKIKLLYKISRNKEKARLFRFFALAEIFCILMSLIAFSLLAMSIICNGLGVVLPNGISISLPVLCAGAVGYFTNFIAVKMLFEPYQRKDVHWLKYLTFGFWKQGLIPANKAEIGKKMAEEISTKLLKPEDVSKEICQIISDKISDKEVLESLRIELVQLFQEHKEGIVKFLLPKIQNSIIYTIDKAVSVENVKVFWDNVVENWLRDENNHNQLACSIIESIKNKSPQLAEIAKTLLQEKIDNWHLARKIDSLMSFAMPNFKLSREVSALVNWEDIEVAIAKKIGEERSIYLIKGEILQSTQKLRTWLDNERSKDEIQAYLKGVKSYLEEFIGGYIEKEVPKLIEEILNSELLWAWFSDEAIPSIKKSLEAWFESNGKYLITKSFNIEEKIIESVEKQDVKEFQIMIDNLASEHLGAIQVIGYVLGIFAGALLMLA